MTRPKGLLVVLSGPSGVGKTTVAHKLLGSADTAPAGTAERRETTPLKGVY